MNIQISPENEQFIHRAVESGAFSDSRQVLDEALGLLRIREALRRDVDAGVDQLDRGEGIDGDTVFGRLRERTNHPTGEYITFGL